MASNKYISISISGLDSLNSKLDTLLENIEMGAEKGIQQAVNTTYELSVLLVKANSGDLRNSIEKSVGLEDSNIVGKVFVDIGRVPYAVYVYYGTGLYNNLGIFAKSWAVPVSKVDQGKVGKYNWKVNQGKDGQEDYYIVEGQRANPFLKDAYESSYELNISSISDEVKNAIMRGL